MPYIDFASSGSGAAPNLDSTYESLGWDTGTGSGQTITAHASANTKGSYSSIGTTASAWAGFILRVYTASISSGRYLLDISVDGSTALVPNIYVQTNSGSSTRFVDIWLPINIASSTNLRARCQCSTGGGTLTVTALGVAASSTSQPGFTTATALTTADTTNTRANTSTINLQGTGASSWTELVASLGATYGAILMTASSSGSAPSNVQLARLSLATGAAASEVLAGSAAAFMYTSAALLPAVAITLQKSFASGTRLSGNIQAALAGTPDTFCIQLIGFA